MFSLYLHFLDTVKKKKIYFHVVTKDTIENLVLFGSF